MCGIKYNNIPFKTNFLYSEISIKQLYEWSTKKMVGRRGKDLSISNGGKVVYTEWNLIHDTF